jgi:L-malate glycosyltransferase
MRIGLLCHRGVGGSARVAVDLAASLASLGHEVHLFARTAPFDVVSRGSLRVHTLATAEAAYPGLDVDWRAEDLDALAELVTGVELEVLHYHYAVPFAAVTRAVVARLGSAAPVTVGTLHGTDVTGFGRRRSAHALGTLLSATDVLTTVSHSHAQLATRLFALPYPPIVIPNFVCLGRFAPLASAPDHRPRIAHVSNLRPVKRPGAMARIFAEVRRHADAELWLLGDGDGSGPVNEILRRANADRDVVRFGVRFDVGAILPHADAVLVTSRTESFSLAALEAAACGLPVVAPRVGGLPEVVRDGVTGLLHAPGDDRAAVRALVGLVADPALRGRMGAAARKRAAEFSAAGVVPRYEELYASLLSAGSAGSHLSTSAVADA